jgi:hypothetical protein
MNTPATSTACEMKVERGRFSTIQPPPSRLKEADAPSGGSE